MDAEARMTTAAESRPYRDRRAGLICFGVIEILLAVLALLGILSLVMVSAMGGALGQAAAAGTSGRTLLPALAMYLAAAVFFSWMGIGSILARRWARALMLIVSWLWLGCGVIGAVSLIWLYPRMQERMSQAAAAGAGGGAGGVEVARTMSMVQSCMLVVMVLLYVVLPLAMLFFYGSRHVKATCEVRDPHLRWTDRCPLPVLGLSVFLGVGAVGVFGTGAVYRTFPVFGVILSGVPAVALALVFAALLAWVAHGAYRLSPWAWWAATSFWLLGGVSWLVTILHPLDWQELYRRMGFTAQQYQQLGLAQFWENRQMLLWSGITLLPWPLYLLWVRRFFVASGGRPESPAAPPASARD